MTKPNIERLVTELHDTLCRCGGRCRGWDNDYIEMMDWVESRYGTSLCLEEILAEWNER